MEIESKNMVNDTVFYAILKTGLSSNQINGNGETFNDSKTATTGDNSQNKHSGNHTTATSCISIDDHILLSNYGMKSEMKNTGKWKLLHEREFR